MIKNSTFDTYQFGSTTWQLNNPGWIRYSDLTKRLGSTGSDIQGMAYFPDYATGRAAFYTYAFVKTYRTFTIYEFCQAVYPYEQGFDPVEISRVVTSAINVPDTTVLDVLDETQRQTMIDAIQKHHGWFPSKLAGRKRTSPGQYL